MRHITSRPLRLLALTLACLGLLAACGDSDDSGGGGDSALVQYFIDNDAPRDEAECVAGELSEFDDDEVIAALESDEPPADAEELVDALFGAIATCGVE